MCPTVESSRRSVTWRIYRKSRLHLTGSTASQKRMRYSEWPGKPRIWAPMLSLGSGRSTPIMIRRDRSGGYRVWHIVEQQSSAKLSDDLAEVKLRYPTANFRLSAIAAFGISSVE